MMEAAQSSNTSRTGAEAEAGESFWDRLPLPATVTQHWYFAALHKQSRIWIYSTIAVAIGAAAYAIFKPSIWEASQAIVVRDEAIGGLSRPGRFDNADAMKTAQETILEIARHQSVVEAALAQAGPPTNLKKGNKWPTAEDIRDAQGSLRVTAPKGAEFGRTELIYLSIEAREKERAAKLATSLCDQLERRLKKLRDDKAQSLITELTRTVALAEADLNEATQRLEAQEGEVGSDLGELRTLNATGAGDSNLRISLNQLRAAISEAKAAQADKKKQIEILAAAQDDPNDFDGLPNKLLETQPGLRRLKEGLVDAQLRTSQLMGTMNDRHPLVQAALAAEEEVRIDFRQELASAQLGLQSDIAVANASIASLQTQCDEVAGKLNRLAGMRANYAALAAEVGHREEIVQKARRDLADARAAKSAAQTTSLLSRVDAPVVGDYPVGPRRSVIVAAGTFGGMFIGCGLVFLIAPRNDGRGRRFTDRFGSRRDRDLASAGRRQADGSPLVTAPIAPIIYPAATRRAVDLPPAAAIEPVLEPAAIERRSERDYVVRAQEARPDQTQAIDPPFVERPRERSTPERPRERSAPEPPRERSAPEPRPERVAVAIEPEPAAAEPAPIRRSPVKLDDMEYQFDPAWVAAAAPSRPFNQRTQAAPGHHMSLTQTLRKIAVQRV